MKNFEVVDLISFASENNFTIASYNIGGVVKELPAKATLIDAQGGCHDAEYNYDTNCWSCVINDLEKALLKPIPNRPMFQLGVDDALPDWFCDMITNNVVTLMNDDPSGRGLETVWAIINRYPTTIIDNKDFVILMPDGSLKIEKPVMEVKAHE